MNTAQIIRMMDQQLGVLKDLDELLAHDAQAKGSHGVAETCVKALREYTDSMRAACEAAKTMAQHYTTKKAEPAAAASVAKTPEPAPKRTKKEKPVEPETTKTVEAVESEDVDLDFLD